MFVTREEIQKYHFLPQYRRVNFQHLPTYFYVQLCVKTNEKRVAKESKKVIQPICVAYEASSPVELPNAASHEMVDTPMFLFNSDKTIPTGQNSELMKMIKCTAYIKSTESL